MRKKLGLAVLAVLMSSAAAVADDDHVAPATAYVKANVVPWLADKPLVDAIKAQNAVTEKHDQTEIDRLDKKWRAEVNQATQPMIQAVLGNELSAYLKKKQDDAKGMITELFVMDVKGLNVGQSEITSDYWQGDEAKWQKTFLVGPDAIFVDKIEKDESTQTLQSQVSITIKDPDTGKPIGSVTVGLNVGEF